MTTNSLNFFRKILEFQVSTPEVANSAARQCCNSSHGGSIEPQRPTVSIEVESGINVVKLRGRSQILAGNPSGRAGSFPAPRLLPLGVDEQTLKSAPTGQGRRRPRERPPPIPRSIFPASAHLASVRSEARMPNTIDVTIPVEPEAAAVLADARNREAMGRLVSRVPASTRRPSPLAQAIAELKCGSPRNGPDGRGHRCGTRGLQRRAPRARPGRLIVFDASTVVSAALKVDSVPERALLRADEIDDSPCPPRWTQRSSWGSTARNSPRPSERTGERSSSMSCAARLPGSHQPYASSIAAIQRTTSTLNSPSRPAQTQS